ncbi:RNA 2',3'-cyclic phosphodiesterase [Conexibacter arvalis]|uniref:RNA 2',3'-cyclic phosphodiesterase n=1 Tax=Conexibacter arvalis TaxID=912552 RepID=A0A840IGV9_9ACTN|nr:RNA 2',3'-cyclic phosphodiesterase [Conexibacter arvalis]MBB4663423.1 2'-5' RNA ligase [Conexibacter arvalis]
MEGQRARLFVALDLPAEVRAELIAWRAPLLVASDAALRPVADEALHVTLCFLGQQPLAAVEPLAAAIAEVTAGGSVAVGGLALGAPLWLPRRRPHALTVALRDRDGALGALQGALAAALAAGGWFAPEERPYLPHVTVARVRRGGDPRALARRELPAPPTHAFAGEAVTLYRSHLGGGGARYEALARERLRRAA